MNKQENEKAAANILCEVLQKIFEGKVEEACTSINMVFLEYPETQASLKTSFLFSLISLTYLNSNCILTEYFYTGLKKLSDDGLGGFFNPNKKYFQDNYDLFAKKRLSCYKRFKVILNELLDRENLNIIQMPVNFSLDKIKNSRPTMDLSCLKDAIPIEENKLRSIISELNYSILISLISDVFNVDYTDELNSISKKKLDRVEFYHTCLVWLVKFLPNDNNIELVELIRKSCRYVLGLTDDSRETRRQFAYEILSKLSQNYPHISLAKDPLTEVECKDIDECSLDLDSEVSLISLATSDEKNSFPYDINSYYEKTTLALEFNELPEFDIFIEDDNSIDGDTTADDEPPTALKLEFD